MEIKEQMLENLISQTEKVSVVAAEIINSQRSLIQTIQNQFVTSQQKLSDELLNLASEMTKNGLNNYAGRLEEYVVKNILQAPYDTQKAYFTHKALFAERHKMAMFLHNHLEKIKETAKSKLKHKNTAQGKVKVFTYWDNENHLPDIVSICRESLKKYVDPTKFDLVILNKSNYTEWTDFRLEDIKATIPQPHFSDLLRSKLLEQWGGFWLDATCLLTEDFANATLNIRQQEQFIFTYAGSRTGSWFIYAKPNSYIMSMISSAIFLWWETENYLTNYFMFHDIVEMLYWVDPEYRQHWNAMQSIHPRNALALLRAYNQKCSESEFNKLMEDSFVHKLTYKYDANKIIPESGLSRLLDMKK